jgi:hypothetical protein
MLGLGMGFSRKSLLELRDELQGSGVEEEDVN